MIKSILILTLISSCFFQKIQSAKTKAEILSESDAACKKYFYDNADDFDKTYPKPQDFAQALKTFCENLKEINSVNKAFNSGNVSYKAGQNEHTADKDFYKKFLPTIVDPETIKRLNSIIPANSNHKRQAAALPSYVNWVEKGFLNPVRSQDCGSCWAFASITLIEAHYAIKFGKNISLSEEHLINCIVDQTGKSGCQGAGIYPALLFAKYKGISTAEQYPHNPNRNGIDTNYCKAGVPTSDVRVLGRVDIPSGDEEALKEAVATKGPIGIAMLALDNFGKYKSGIYDDPECENSISAGGQSVNHNIIIVGYGEENGIPYWLIRNSWGASWGTNGYAKMRRGYKSSIQKGICNIAASTTYPIVDSVSAPVEKTKITDPAPASYPGKICDNKQHANDGCKSSYICQFYQSSMIMGCPKADLMFSGTGSIWKGNWKTGDDDCVPRKWNLRCNDSIKLNKLPNGDYECPSEGVFMLPGCGSYIRCGSSYREINCPEGNYFDEKYKKCVKYPQDPKCPQQTPPSNPTPKKNLICDQNDQLVSGSGCQKYYSCSYQQGWPYSCWGSQVWNVAAQDADCVDPGIIPCNASSTWSGCQSEGTFLIEGCSKRVTCTLRYQENNCDDGKYFDQKYKKCVKYPQDPQCPQQNPPTNPAPRTDINCDGKYHTVPGTGCKNFYYCSYRRNSMPYGCSSGQVWNVAAKDADCVPSGIVACNAPATWTGCKAEGLFLTQDCTTRESCALRKIDRTVPWDGYYFDESSQGYTSDQPANC